MFLRQRYIGIFWGPADKYKGFQSLLHLVVGIKILYAQVEFVWDICPTTAAYVTYHWQKFLFWGFTFVISNSFPAQVVLNIAILPTLAVSIMQIHQNI